MARLLTFAEDNQFTFVCPIFNATTKIASCIKLREVVYMGNRPDKRVGCQAAMRCGKCPSNAVVDQIIWGKFPEGTPDNYGSKEPVLGKLRSDILQKVHRILLQDKVLSSYPLSDAERQLLMTANERIEEQLKTAPQGVGKFASRDRMSDSGDRAPRRKTREQAGSRAPSSARNDNLADAARSGDLSVAVSAVS